MKRMVCASIALILLLAGYSAPDSTLEPKESFAQGIYEFAFSVEQLSGYSTDEWDFVYTYNGEAIVSGHQITFPLEIFSFHSIQVEIIEKDNTKNKFSANIQVAICDGGSGKTEVTVTDSGGKTAIFKIICKVTRIR